MREVIKPVMKLLFLLGSLILFYLLIEFVAAVVQLAEAADRLYMGLGQPVFLGLMVLLFTLVASPLYIYFKIPMALVPPNVNSGPEYVRYMEQLRQRLAKNPRLTNVQISNDEDVKLALKFLSEEADIVIRKTAKNVFIGTAISQNGRLDGLITIVTQVKMVWQIACIYNQRPSPRQMFYLYSNVAVSALLAESVEDVDFAEITGPLLSSVGLGAMAAIPGAAVIMNSISSGASNAFLTLRVGGIANQYCEATSIPNRSIVRRAATLAAASLVVAIVKDNSAPIFAAAWKVLKKNAEDVVEMAKNVAGSTVNTLSRGVDSVIDGAQNVASKVADTASTRAEVVVDTVSQSLNVIRDVLPNADSLKNISGQVTEKATHGAKSVGDAVTSTIDVAKSTVVSVTQKTQSFGSNVSSATSSAAQYVKSILPRKG